MQLGFVGLGAMGLPMTRHLLEAGHRVTVLSRSPGPVARAVALGAVAAASPAEVAGDAEVVVLCVPSSPQVVEVVGEMLPVLRPGQVVVDCSTIDPDVERAQHERVRDTGAGFLDAPLSGGTAGAEKGTLTLMVGGEAETLASTREALEPFAGLIVHVGGPGMGQVVKLCNNLIYASQMLATAEATALALRSGVDMAKLHEVLVHSTGDCVAVRTRLPVPGVLDDSPATNDWRPGFMTDLMAKDLDLALAYGARAGVPLSSTAVARQALTAASTAGYGREDFSALAKVVFGLARVGVTGGPLGQDAGAAPGTGLATPALVLAADHRARGVMTIERYDDYLAALAAALPHTDGILATAQPLGDLARLGHLRPEQRTYLSVNRTGLAGTVFELDDRLVASVARAAADGWSGVKLMTRIDGTDPGGAAALELLGQVLEDARDEHVEAMIEPLWWRDGRMSRVTSDIVSAAVVAHDLGAPLLKVPVPEEPTGPDRIRAVERVVASVGVPVLFLGGPHRRPIGDGVVDEARDVMAGGGAGLAIGRAILEAASPSAAAQELAEVVHAG